MRTQQQDVAAAREKIASLKADWMKALSAYNALAKDDEAGRVAGILECQRAANAYFNYAEDFVGDSSLLGAHEDALWAQGFAEDCVEILKCLPMHFEILETAFQDSARLASIPWRPGETAFASMQRMVKLYLKKDIVQALEARFRNASLPTYGFENKARSIMQRDKLLSFIFGTVFVIVLLAIAWLKPEPSKFQYDVFRTVLALAGAGIGAVLPGTLQVDVSKWVRAGGAMAIFTIVYFWVPASLI